MHQYQDTTVSTRPYELTTASNMSRLPLYDSETNTIPSVIQIWIAAVRAERTPIMTKEQKLQKDLCEFLAMGHGNPCWCSFHVQQAGPSGSAARQMLMSTTSSMQETRGSPSQRIAATSDASSDDFLGSAHLNPCSRPSSAGASSSSARQKSLSMSNDLATDQQVEAAGPSSPSDAAVLQTTLSFAPSAEQMHTSLGFRHIPDTLAHVNVRSPTPIAIMAPAPASTTFSVSEYSEQVTPLRPASERSATPEPATMYSVVSLSSEEFPGVADYPMASERSATPDLTYSVSSRSASPDPPTPNARVSSRLAYSPAPAHAPNQVPFDRLDPFTRAEWRALTPEAMQRLYNLPVDFITGEASTTADSDYEVVEASVASPLVQSVSSGNTVVEAMDGTIAIDVAFEAMTTAFGNMNLAVEDMIRLSEDTDTAVEIMDLAFEAICIELGAMVDEYGDVGTHYEIPDAPASASPVNNGYDIVLSSPVPRSS
jgi:hypothetical protein